MARLLCHTQQDRNVGPRYCHCGVSESNQQILCYGDHRQLSLSAEASLAWCRNSRTCQLEIRVIGVLRATLLDNIDDLASFWILLTMSAVAHMMLVGMRSP